MAKLVLVVCALLALSSAALIQPRDLASEAEEQLQQLTSLIQGDILAAHNDLVDLGTDFQSYTANVYENGAIDLQQEHETIDAEVTSVVDLAMSAGYDVTSCTNIREQVLDRLPAQYSVEMNTCIADVNRQRETVLSNSRYIIDVVINRVHDLSNQLRNCRGEILCISPVLTEIQLNKIRLPQNIQTEVQAAENLLSILRLSVDSCADDTIAAYVAQASSILRDITACIDRIIG